MVIALAIRIAAIARPFRELRLVAAEGRSVINDAFQVVSTCKMILSYTLIIGLLNANFNTVSANAAHIQTRGC
jgi:hypothetical protein